VGPFDSRVLNYDAVQIILYERIKSFSPKNEEYLRAKHLDGALKWGARGKCLAHLPLNTPQAMVIAYHVDGCVL